MIESPSATTAYYWKCSTAGLPSGSCHGDTLLPGYYGDLTLTGNSRALLLTEGLVQNAMEDEHNLSLQLQRVQHEVQEYLQE